MRLEVCQKIAPSLPEKYEAVEFAAAIADLDRAAHPRTRKIVLADR